MRTWFPRFVVVLSFAGALGTTSPLLAQDAAEALFNRGVEEMQAGRHAAACPLIAESHRLDPRPGTLFTLATCEEGGGRVATAARLYAEYLALYESLPDDRKTAQKLSGRPKLATERRDKLAMEIPELTILLTPGAPAGTVVKRDGQVMSESAMGMALRVDPGEHVMTTQTPGGPLWETKVTLTKGEKKAFVLEIRLPSAAPLPVVGPLPVVAPPPAAEGSSGRRVAGYGIGGAGVAGIAVGGVLGGLVFGKKGTIAAHCGAGIHSKDEAACDPTGLAATSTARSMALGSTAAIAAGTGLLGAGLVLVLTARARATPADTAQVSVSVLSLGPAGAIVGFHGAW